MRQLDEQAIAEVGIPSLILMENAGLEAARIISAQASKKNHTGEILVFCGKGKNGGDGLVVARHLLARGHKIRIFLCDPPALFKSESLTNLTILKNLKAKITTVDNASIVSEYFESANPPYFVVDAILGTGLDRDIEGLYLDVIETINRKSTHTVSLDIPSGVRGDTGSIAGTSIQANATISFGYPRIGHFLTPGAARRGSFFNIDLGFPRRWAHEGEKFLLTQDRIGRLVKHRDRFGHKNTFGHCLLIGGSPGRLGAIVMSSQSCLKMGTGLVTVASWQDSFPSLDLKVPSEVMTYSIRTDDPKFGMASEGFLNQFSAVAIGPGLGVQKDGVTVLKYLLDHYAGPLLIDADGLNLIAEAKLHGELLRRQEPCILTPHPGEMSRLLKMEKQHVLGNPLAAIRQAVEMTGATIILKGATSLIHSPEGVTYFNHYPNDGMAKAGSGDVLAGMIGGLLGQKMAGIDAAKLGVFTHTLAGKLAAESNGERSMTATDITSHIDGALKELKSQNKSGIENAAQQLF